VWYMIKCKHKVWTFSSPLTKHSGIDASLVKVNITCWCALLKVCIRYAPHALKAFHAHCMKAFMVKDVHARKMAFRHSKFNEGYKRHIASNNSLSGRARITPYPSNHPLHSQPCSSTDASVSQPKVVILRCPDLFS
jgi:hypothetical protein